MVACGMRMMEDVETVLRWLRAVGAQRLVIDSRQVRPGDAFVAWPGASRDARAYVPQALAAGACACLVAQEGLEAHAFEDERVVAMPRLKQRLGELCAAFNGHPSRTMEVVAYTGTNGKTSSTWWLAQASSLLGSRSALVGTLGIGEPPLAGGAADDAGRWTATGLTTPDPAALHAGLAELGSKGVRRCAIEASSIGIEEHRLQGLDITVAAFTNFTQDHLDYHGSLQAYWAAKRRLFDWPTLRAVVINIDDPQGRALDAELKLQRPALQRWTYGLEGPARLKAVDFSASPAGMSFEVQEAGGPGRRLSLPFLGRYNLLNLLGVVAALRALGHALEDILSVLPRLGPVPGRLQAQGGAGEPLAVVDYAHTPDALEKALQALRPVAQARGGRLWCVFGCGGDRDRSKRPLMGAIAARLADSTVLTSDNPRTEDPLQILADIRSGWPTDAAVRVLADRGQAIAWALDQAHTRDVVLVAGKGHEDYQEIQGQRQPCRDGDLVGTGLAERRAAGFMMLGDVADSLPGSRLLGEAQVAVARLHTDTRSLQQGDLFLALRGERFDGHDFLPQVAAAGAAAVAGERGLQASGLPGLEVDDSLQALQELARRWRAQLSLPVVAVTGSNGKTTVTQMVAGMLRAWCGPRAAATRGNLNNHIGVPLSVLALRAGQAHGHAAAVFELGMNHPGEVAVLASIAQPTVALVNNAQREHLEFMRTVQAVAEENGSVLQALPADGVAVFPADDEHAGLWSRMAGAARVWRFAIEWLEADAEPASAAAAAAPEVRGAARWCGDHWSLWILSPVGSLNTTLRMPGRHNVHNAVAAAACALAAGAPAAAVAQGLAGFRAVAGRSLHTTVVRGGRTMQLIDDTYNANPDSVRAAIEVLAAMPGPRALILGDMGEVGDQGPALHAEVGDFARQRGIDHLWALGELSAHAAAAFGPAARHFDAMAALVQAFNELPAVGSMLIKGSRFMRMERALQALQPGSGEAH